MIQYIQILRLFAAIAVVLHHARPPIIPAHIFTELPKWLDSLAAMGFAGVDIFFVISGVIMAETTRQLTPGPRAALKFTAARFTRIYSGWWPFFFMYLAANFFMRGIPEDRNLLASFFLLPQNLNHQLLPIVWTLCFELYFYIVLGALLVFKRKTIQLALIFWALAVVIFSAFNWFSGLYTPSRFGEINQLHDFYGSPLILEFVAGFFILEFIRAKPETSWMPFAFVSAVLAAFATWYQLTGSLSPSGMAGFHHLPERVLFIGGAASGLVASALLWKAPNGRLALLLARLGDASYAMYLSHIALIYGICLSLIAVGVTQISSPTLLLICIASVSLYSWFHYCWIERPLYQALRTRLFSAPATSISTHHA